MATNPVQTFFDATHLCSDKGFDKVFVFSKKADVKLEPELAKAFVNLQLATTTEEATSAFPERDGFKSFEELRFLVSA